MAYIQRIRSQVGHTPVIMTSASGALLNHGKVLLQARADTGDWGFPGGYMEYGESFEETLKREFKEDAGYEVVPVRFLGILDHDFYTYPNGDEVQPINAIYLVKRVNDRQFTVKPTETTQVQYWDIKKAMPKMFNHQHEEIWQMVKENYEHQSR